MSDTDALTKKWKWMIFTIIIGMILICGMAFLIPTCSHENRAETIAINALKLKVANPETLKILGISKPDSVFRNRYCPEYEVMELSEKFMQYSMKMMEEYDSHDDKLRNPVYIANIERYSDNSEVIDRLNRMLEKEPGEFCGWRIRIRYLANDESNTPFKSEMWFIFDSKQEHILNSFDIPML